MGDTVAWNSSVSSSTPFTQIFSLKELVPLTSTPGRKLYLDFSRFLIKDNFPATEILISWENVLQVINKFGKDVNGIKFSGSKISAPGVCKLLIPLTNSSPGNVNRLTSLKYLDVSFISLSLDAFEAICSMVHPTKGTYSIKVLILSKCSLGTAQVSHLFQSLCGNNIIEEVVVSGNNCGDAAVPKIVSFLLEYKNIVTKLGIGGNKITSKGMQQLCNILEKPHLLLTDFEIHDNVDIKDSELSTMFTSISTANKLQRLNLSNCGIHECEWARFLCFIESLTYLNLSHNSIGDDALVELLRSIDNCYCLRHLDLSYNLFGGIKCNVLQRTLSHNRGLYRLSLAGNKFDSSIWTSISLGLMDNAEKTRNQSQGNADNKETKWRKCTLDTLDVSSCKLSLPHALKLCESFQRNDFVSIVMAGNPLPSEMIRDPREYCRTQAIAPTMEGGSYFSRRRDTAADIMISSAAWRKDRAQGVKESLSSLEVAAQKTVSEREAKLSRAPALGSSKGPQSSDNVDSADMDSDRESDLPRPASLSALSSASLTAAEYNAEVLQQSEYYLSPEAVKEIIAAEQLVNTKDAQRVFVCYGRSSVEIGEIWLHSTDTYKDGKELVRNLVASYLATVDAATRNRLVSGFGLLDPSGKPVASEDDQNFRRIWSEMCAAKTDLLIVRPADWITL